MNRFILYQIKWLIIISLGIKAGYEAIVVMEGGGGGWPGSVCRSYIQLRLSSSL